MADFDHALASDLDGTLIDVELPAGELDVALSAFADAMAGSPVGLWFNSSRPVASQRRSLAEVKGLPTPAFMIGAMGTQIETPDGDVVEAYGREQFGDWPRDAVDRLAREAFALEPHPPDMQTRFKASYHLPDPSRVDAIRKSLHEHDLPAKVVFSGGKDLDLLPPAAGKAAAIAWLADRVGLPRGRVCVSGDSANDLDMFRHPFRGIVVANAHPELKALTGDGVYHAAGRCAAGVLEGLRYWRVLP